MGFTPSSMATIAKQVGYEIQETVELAAKSAKYSPVPSRLDSNVASYLRERYPNGLYAHQSDAIAVAIGGGDVCLATPTASGKSLVFMTAALHLLQTQPRARVLALYPARALIQDQNEKWNGMFGSPPNWLTDPFTGGIVHGERG